MKNGIAEQHEFKIEKGLPCPTGRIAGKRKYPFLQLKVGDSFYVQEYRLKSSMYTLAKSDGVKISLRVEGEGFRVWRIA